jgi:hypothetical protein
MGWYQVNKVLNDMSRDRGLVERIATEPNAVFEQYRLSEQEAEAIRERKLGTLLDMKVNPYVLLKAAMAMRIDFPGEYLQLVNQPR